MSLTKDSKQFHLFERSYWQYYLELEEQLMRTRRYIAFDEVNFNTYSIEYLKLYQAVCSEIDVVGKEIAFQIDSSLQQKKNIVLNRWWYVVLPEFGDKLKNGEVKFYRTYGPCCDYSENTGCLYQKDDGSCWFPFGATVDEQIKQ